MKYNETFNIPGAFKVSSSKPIDTRSVVENDADLLNDSALPNIYNGIIVYSEESETHYKWNGLDRTNADNWVAVGGEEGLWELVQENPYNLKVPTIVEWEDEVDSWATQDFNGPFDSVLKLTLGGSRIISNGSFQSVGGTGNYWSSTLDGQSAEVLFFSILNVFNFPANYSSGFSLRLIIDGEFTQQDFDNNYANETVTINEIDYGFVYNATTQRIWLDRNLGATQVATSLTDANAYGDLFQWGRGADGHEKRDSNTTSIQSTTACPEHGDFIINNNNWLTTDNTALWQGIYGSNNPAIVREKLIGKNCKKVSYNDLLDKPEIPEQIEASSGLEAIDEGNGTGWRLKGRNPDNFGSLGFGAVDLSENDTASTTAGATGTFSKAEGYRTKASGYASKAEGFETIADGNYAKAVGNGTRASGTTSRTEGLETQAIGNVSHAEGERTVASGDGGAHAEGFETEASGNHSHAEGQQTTASGAASHTEGFKSEASSEASHAEGFHNFARSKGEHAGGIYGTDYTPLGDDTDRIFNIGIGKSIPDRKDGLTLFKNGALRIWRSALNSITNAMAGMLIFNTNDGNRPYVHNGNEWNGVAYKLKTYTVATLPASPSPGDEAIVTDGASVSYRASVIGGGTEYCKVFYNGSTWIYQ